MTSVKLYKLLQRHTGIVNDLAVKLSKEEITKEEAKRRAGRSVRMFLEDINKKTEIGA